MTAVNTRVISEKLMRLDHLIRELEDIKRTPREEFLNDNRLQAATERYFILAIEIITDIGNHLLVEHKGIAGVSYEDIIRQLGIQNIIPLEVSRRNEGMAKFRNLLVHVYEVTDANLVYEYLQKAPDEFRAFAQAFAKHI